MQSNSFSQSASKRAWKDAEIFRSKARWFWGVEVVGSGLITGLTAWMLWDKSMLNSWQVGIITFAVFVVGIFIVYGLIFLWYLFRAPYTQRNEARNWVIELESGRNDKEKRAQIRRDIGALIIEGAKVLESYKSIRTFREYWPEKEFKNWAEKVEEVLRRYELDTQYPLWVKDVDIKISNLITLTEYIAVCEAGLSRLEGILETLVD